MHLQMRELIGYGVYAGVCTLAILAGGRPERLAAALLITLQVLTTLLQPPPGHMGDLALGLFVLDVAFFLGLCRLLDVYRRRWLVWAAALQGLAIATHFARWLDPSVGRWGYATADVLWGYGVLATLLAACLERLRASGRHGRGISSGNG